MVAQDGTSMGHSTLKTRGSISQTVPGGSWKCWSFIAMLQGKEKGIPKFMFTCYHLFKFYRANSKP